MRDWLSGVLKTYLAPAVLSVEKPLDDWMATLPPWSGRALCHRTFCDHRNLDTLFEAKFCLAWLAGRKMVA